MLLSHFTNTPIKTIKSVQQKLEPFPHTKPKGLWVSVDGEDDWEKWCHSESFGIGKLRYRVKLEHPDSVLWISTPDELLNFTHNYGKEKTFGAYTHRFILWPKVVNDYSGIIIAPYQWSLRLDDRTHWYYGWDCASGCIWDANIVGSVTLVPEEAKITA